MRKMRYFYVTALTASLAFIIFAQTEDNPDAWAPPGLDIISLIKALLAISIPTLLVLWYLDERRYKKAQLLRGSQPKVIPKSKPK